MNRVTISADFCKGCGLCAAACPRKIVSLDERAMNKMGYRTASVVAPEKCSGCALCALICPDAAILVEKEV
ncbi:MAG: ferredoxin family protein [Clostridiales bacterium]|jgi:2-oxoglutarate ferredoxin oxidoreductase subunit delta|nr:ferredoxin family protein [Clostridiales bacterium]HOA84480.1 ferredoxin family protein [Bacillota bacterium]